MRIEQLFRGLPGTQSRHLRSTLWVLGVCTAVTAIVGVGSAVTGRPQPWWWFAITVTCLVLMGISAVVQALWLRRR